MTPGRLVLRVQMLAVIVGVVSCLCLDDVRATEDGKADVVLRNGKIYTADPARSIRQSIAFTGNTIVAVGDDKDMTPLIGSGTKVIDLGGKLVLPGLIDTHIHPIIGALTPAKLLARSKLELRFRRAMSMILRLNAAAPWPAASKDFSKSPRRPRTHRWSGHRPRGFGPRSSRQGSAHSPEWRCRSRGHRDGP